MAKASIPGKAKTRLVPPLTFDEAARLNTAFLLDIADNLQAAGSEIDIAPYMAFGPTGSAPFFKNHLPSRIGLIEIWLPDFGECLYRTITALLDLGYGAACVLNSDSPTLPTETLVSAASSLARPGDRAILGPCMDGGYYLLGLKRAHHRLFEEVAWSTDIVAEQTVQRAREIGLEIQTLPSWYDVDDAIGLRQLQADISAPFRGALAPRRPAHTIESLTALAAGDATFELRAFGESTARAARA